MSQDGSTHGELGHIAPAYLSVPFLAAIGEPARSP